MRTSFAFFLLLAVLLTGCNIQYSHNGGYYDGYSQSVAQLYYPPAGCEDGPLSVAIINRTQMYMEMTIDGEYIDFVDDYGSYAQLEPQATAFLCLENTGVHAITGQAYVERYGELRKVAGRDGDFTWTGSFGTEARFNGRNEFVITAGYLTSN